MSIETVCNYKTKDDLYRSSFNSREGRSQDARAQGEGLLQEEGDTVDVSLLTKSSSKNLGSMDRTEENLASTG